jgi:hypothetical protein
MRRVLQIQLNRVLIFNPRAFPGQQLYNKIMKKFSITAYVIFPTLQRPCTCFLTSLSHSEKKWIHHRNPLPFIYTSKL